MVFVVKDSRLKETSEISELTSIRFFAALHVLLFHNFYTAGWAASGAPDWIRSIISYGDLAVTFFFLLSGFIITYVYADEEGKVRGTKKKFYLARFSRIYPVYLFAFMLDLPRGLSYFFETFETREAVLKICVSAVAHLTMLQSWHPRLTPVWNSPAWSLSAEMFFYLIAPFAMRFLFKAKNNWTLMWILFLIPPVLYYAIWNFTSLQINHDPALLVLWRSFPLLRSTEFLIGIFLGKLFIQEHWVIKLLKSNTILTGTFFWLSLLLSVLIISIKVDDHQKVIANTLLIPLFSMMILAIASVRVPLTQFLRSEFTISLGRASFAMYMIHVPMLFYVDFLFKKLALGPGPTYFVGYLLLTISFSIILFKFLEQPLQRYLRKKLL